MQYVRSISGSVSKTWNSINPATLSGAIDVIVVEHEDGTLACSPFHVRFGKFSLLRPSDKKVEFKVNDVEQDYAMKLGEGGEAFFVFETSASVPVDLQTSPLASPAISPQASTLVTSSTDIPELPEPEPLDLAVDNQRSAGRRRGTHNGPPMLTADMRAKSDFGLASLTLNPSDHPAKRPVSGDWGSQSLSLPQFNRSVTNDALPTIKSDIADQEQAMEAMKSHGTPEADVARQERVERSESPSPQHTADAVTRAISLSKKLWGSNIPSQVTDEGDLMLDMTGYKSSEEEVLRAEVIARRILSEELEGSYDIGSLIGADGKGNIWIYSSEEAKDAASRKAALQNLSPHALISSDAVSDPGYHSDDDRSVASENLPADPARVESDSAVGLVTPPASPEGATAGDPNRNYAKTLRLTSDQLKALQLKPGPNPMSFSVNRATCQAYMYYWRHDDPIVISDIDGTITKSDALGHVLNMIGRDWTHQGVAKLYSEIVANGYNILYLTSRSVGQADTTRAYLNGVIQDGFKLPRGPVIMSPDRTMAALRREVYLRKPEVFKMACLRDIMSLFSKPVTPFYAGFGNRLTDALSYRSVNIPSTRIFTINSDSEVSLDLLSLNKYKTGYVSMREIVDHFFPPVGLLLQQGAEEFTDFNYWRDRPLELADFSGSESESDSQSEGETGGGLMERESLASEDDANETLDEDGGDDLEASYFSRDSIDESAQLGDSIIESVEGGDLPDSTILEQSNAENENILPRVTIEEHEDAPETTANDLLSLAVNKLQHEPDVGVVSVDIVAPDGNATNERADVDSKSKPAASEVHATTDDDELRTNLHGLAKALTPRKGREGQAAAAKPQHDEAVRVA